MGAIAYVGTLALGTRTDARTPLVGTGISEQH